MSIFNIIAGDLPKCKASSVNHAEGVIRLNSWKLRSIRFSDFDAITEESRDASKSLIQKGAWGLVGAATFGVAGAAAGLISGGEREVVRALCRTHGGKVALIVMDGRTFRTIEQGIRMRDMDPSTDASPEHVQAWWSAWPLVLCAMLTAFAMVNTATGREWPASSLAIAAGVAACIRLAGRKLREVL